MILRYREHRPFILLFDPVVAIICILLFRPVAIVITGETALLIEPFSPVVRHIRLLQRRRGGWLLLGQRKHFVRGGLVHEGLSEVYEMLAAVHRVRLDRMLVAAHIKVELLLARQFIDNLLLLLHVLLVLMVSHYASHLVFILLIIFLFLLVIRPVCILDIRSVFIVIVDMRSLPGHPLSDLF